MSMTSVFCDVDDFCLIFEPQWHKQLICNNKKSPVISKLTLSEIMTIIICFHQSAFRDFKHYYLSHIVRHKSDSFPNLVSYNRFVELMKTTLIPTVYLKTKCMGKPVCRSLILRLSSFVIIIESITIRCSEKKLNVERHLLAGSMDSNFT